MHKIAISLVLAEIISLRLASRFLEHVYLSRWIPIKWKVDSESKLLSKRNVDAITMSQVAAITSQYQLVFTGESGSVIRALHWGKLLAVWFTIRLRHTFDVGKLCKISFFFLFSFFLARELCNPILSSILLWYPILREKIVPSCSRYIGPFSLSLSPSPPLSFSPFSMSVADTCVAIFALCPPSSCVVRFTREQAVRWKTVRIILHKPHIWYNTKKLGAE